MAEYRFEHVTDIDDPNRCQGSGKKGSCPFKKVPGSDFCPRHGANSELISQRIDSLRNYRLQKWQGRINEFADNDQLKSLREEIGILRILLEETLNRCQDQSDLLLYASKISELVMKIRDIVVSCNRLESTLGIMIDKAAAMQLAGEFVEIISRHVKDQDLIDSISGEIGEAITRVGTKAQLLESVTNGNGKD